MPVPNLFIIGAPKCGTTALAHYISEHPEAFICDPKEPFYFCDDFPRLRQAQGLTDDAAYLALFDGADPARHKAIGEGSTNYLRSETAVANALRMNADAKFIAMLRNPVEVVHAFHMELHFSRNEDEADFETAWRLQDARARGERIPESAQAELWLQYREMAMFSRQIERFFALVPEDQRLVLLQEDLNADCGAVYRQALAFLGLPDDGRTEFPRVNAAHAHRSEFLAKLILTPPGPLKAPVEALRGVLRRNRIPLVETLKRKLRKDATREAMSPAFRAELEDLYREDVARTGALLGRDLSHWLPARDPASAPAAAG